MREKITRLREARKLSRYMLAKRAETSRSYLDAVERGQADPSIGWLIKVAHALGVPVGELLE